MTRYPKIVLEKYWSAFILVSDNGFWCKVPFPQFIRARIGQHFVADWQHEPDDRSYEEVQRARDRGRPVMTHARANGLKGG